ncbi:MAG TPA: 23S rRNA (adenine(2503)-C(2))-methyltransferase RlmN [Victivallales bacterium]|nr:23S rRNA (adenine(2503)-C(2))-methyltransferase RlmN [Victivallales bacterium]
MKNKQYIYSITLADLKDSLPDIQAYRYKQIINWIYNNNIYNPEKMSNIPADIKNKLAEAFECSLPKILKQSKTSDKTDKYLVKLKDDETIEFVIIHSPQRKTLCLSSQVGCPVQCKFCASGMFGLNRNLTKGEIVSQFLLASEYIGKTPDNVVFMGIGEPLLNYNNLISALETICSQEYFNYASRRVTISTSGIPKYIIKLANLSQQWNLALSLHATDDVTRSKLIPDKSRYEMEEILKSCKYYFSKTGRIITLEYTLIKDINDSTKQAKELAGIAKNMRAKVNLIPFNKVLGCSFARPEKNACLKFASILQSNGISFTFRLEKGNNIDAACGQLRASNLKENIK